MAEFQLEVIERKRPWKRYLYADGVYFKDRTAAETMSQYFSDDVYWSQIIEKPVPQSSEPLGKNEPASTVGPDDPPPSEHEGGQQHD